MPVARTVSASIGVLTEHKRLRNDFASLLMQVKQYHGNNEAKTKTDEHSNSPSRKWYKRESIPNGSEEVSVFFLNNPMIHTRFKISVRLLNQAHLPRRPPLPLWTRPPVVPCLCRPARGIARQLRLELSEFSRPTASCAGSRLSIRHHGSD